LRDALLIGTSRRIEYAVRRDLFAHLDSLSFLTYRSKRTGDMMSRATTDIEGVRMMVGPAVMHFTNTLVMTPTIVFYMVGLNWRLTIAAMVPMVLAAVFTRVIGGRMYRLSFATQERLGDVSTKAQENFAGIRVVKAFGQESQEIGDFRAQSRNAMVAQLRLSGLRGVFHGAIAVFTTSSTLLFVWFAPGEIEAGRLTISEAIAFFAYQELITWPMMAFGWTAMLFQRGMASVRRLNEIFDLEPAVVDPVSGDGKPARYDAPGSATAMGVAERPAAATDADSPAPSETAQAVAASGKPLPDFSNGIRGAIELQNVTFRYSDELAPVLHNVSVRIEPGETVAFMGPIGTGKSTLVQLVPRLYDPTEGRVLIDGVDARQIPLDLLRRSVGYAPQDGFLFSESIAYNIGFAIDDYDEAQRTDRKRARLIRDKIEEVGSVAQLTKDVREFENGYDQVVGERGVTLSGGQKQRVALARALLTDPRILILDDSFSAVDTHTEEGILAGLRRFLGKRTTLLVAHRVSTVRDADRIYVLLDGKIAEQGTDAELMAHGGFYAEMATRQRLEGELEGL
jgi:ATP-binding cassette subfamily B multidrug efflux pump